jgi:hypothetical protein
MGNTGYDLFPAGTRWEGAASDCLTSYPCLRSSTRGHVHELQYPLTAHASRAPCCTGHKQRQHVPLPNAPARDATPRTNHRRHPLGHPIAATPPAPTRIPLQQCHAACRCRPSFAAARHACKHGQHGAGSPVPHRAERRLALLASYPWPTLTRRAHLVRARLCPLSARPLSATLRALRNAGCRDVRVWQLLSQRLPPSCARLIWLPASFGCTACLLCFTDHDLHFSGDPTCFLFALIPNKHSWQARNYWGPLRNVQQCTDHHMFRSTACVCADKSAVLRLPRLTVCALQNPSMGCLLAPSYGASCLPTRSPVLSLPGNPPPHVYSPSASSPAPALPVTPLCAASPSTREPSRVFHHWHTSPNGALCAPIPMSQLPGGSAPHFMWKGPEASAAFSQCAAAAGPGLTVQPAAVSVVSAAPVTFGACQQ